MEELLTTLYDEARSIDRLFKLRGASVMFVGYVDDILDHGVITLSGHWYGTNKTVAVLVPAAHIEYVVEA